MKTQFSELPNFIWSIANLLRGEFKQSQYGRIILPFTLLRRLECVLAPTKEKVLAEAEKCTKMSPDAAERILRHKAGLSFYNISSMDLRTLGETQVLDNLETYIQSFSPSAREVFEHFRFSEFIEKLNEANLLYIIAHKFAGFDLSPATVPNYEMGLIFEELIRRFAESSNETAGEHFTPRDIVRLTTSLVFSGDDDELEKLSLFAYHLRPLLHEEKDLVHIDLSDLEMTHYRLNKQGVRHLQLEEGMNEEYRLKGITDLGTGRFKDEEIEFLSDIIARLNEIFAEDFTDDDLFNYTNTIVDKVRENDVVMKQLENNSPDQALMGDLPNAVEHAVIETMEIHENFAKQLLEDEDKSSLFGNILLRMLLKQIEA